MSHESSQHLHVIPSKLFAGCGVYSELSSNSIGYFTVPYVKAKKANKSAERDRLMCILQNLASLKIDNNHNKFFRQAELLVILSPVTVTAQRSKSKTIESKKSRILQVVENFYIFCLSTSRVCSTPI